MDEVSSRCDSVLTLTVAGTRFSGLGRHALSLPPHKVTAFLKVYQIHALPEKGV